MNFAARMFATSLAALLAMIVWSIASAHHRLPEWTIVEFDRIELADDGDQDATVDGETIESLIADLAAIEELDVGSLTQSWGEPQFSPVEETEPATGNMLPNRHRIRNETVRRVVSIGPEAIPLLVQSLSDETPTKLTIKPSAFMVELQHGSVVPINPARLKESAVRTRHEEFFRSADTFTSMRMPQAFNPDGEGRRLDQHSVTVGDLAYFVIGQIVNRPYFVARHQGKASTLITSPTHEPQVAEIVREIWESENPRQSLLDSLMTDLHTRGENSDDLQCGAAMRLLYYFPDESADVIAQRLLAFDVSTGLNPIQLRNRKEANGVRIEQFLQAIASFDHPTVVDARLEVLRETSDSYIFASALGEAVVERDRDLVFEQMKAQLSAFPPDPRGPFGGDYYILKAAAKYYPEKARELWAIFARHGTPTATQTLVNALSDPAETKPWMVDFLTSMLDNKTNAFGQYGPQYDSHHIRICDEAAKVLAESYLEGVEFRIEKSPEFLDTQIEKIKRVLQGEKDVSFDVPAGPIIPDDIQLRDPLRVVSLDDFYAVVYDFSTADKLWLGRGYRNGGVYEFASFQIDSESGEVLAQHPHDFGQSANRSLRPRNNDHVICRNTRDGVFAVIDARTGNEVRRIETPFRTKGFIGNGELSVSSDDSICVTGDGEWLLVASSGSLYSINVETGERNKEWSRPGNRHRAISDPELIPIAGSAKAIIEDGLAFNSPLRIWDQATQTMTEIEKVPPSGWEGAWGDIAWQQSANSPPMVWNLAERQRIELPDGDSEITSVLCDKDQTTLFLLRRSGSVDVLRIVDGTAIEPLAQLTPSTDDEDLHIQLCLCEDDRTLIWMGSPIHMPGPDGKGIQLQHTEIAIFDVSDLTRNEY